VIFVSVSLLEAYNKPLTITNTTVSFHCTNSYYYYQC